jgi:hypothetical protein
VTRSIGLLIFAVSVAAAACVSLDKPQAVVACEKANNCTDSTTPVQNGGAGGAVSAKGGAGGATGSGGVATTAVASGGAAGTSTTGQGSGGVASGGTASTGLTATGGSVAAGGADGGAMPATGGMVGAGGAGGEAGLDSGTTDAPIGSGGAVSSGGASTSGGTVGTGGVPGSGGVIASGGAEANTGGHVGTGGTVATGGTTATGGAPAYNCAAALSPTSGLVTDFTNWNATTSTWTSGSLTGNAYRYGSSSSSTTVKVEGSPAGLHLTGSIPSNNYGGAGLTFLSCVTATGFTKITFDVYGNASNCSIELQLQTYDQRPADQTPPGGCKADGGSSCFKFPVASQVVNLGNGVAAPGTTVSVTLSSMSNWTSAAAGQLVGLQWQFTPNNGTCTPNATFTNVKLVQ